MVRRHRCFDRHEALQLLDPVLDDDEAAGAAVCSAPPPSLIIRNRWPSGEMSYVRPGNAARSREVAFLDQQRRCRGRPRRAALHADAHERTCRRDIEQLLPAPRPERPRAAAGRHLPVAAVHVRKRPHVDLELARIVRLVGEPAAVGRDDPVPLGERGLHERRHATGPVQLHLHHVLAGLRGRLGEDQAAAVGRHGPRHSAYWGSRSAARPRRCHPPPARRDSARRPFRAEDHPAAVGRPYRIVINATSNVSAGERRARRSQTQMSCS